MRRPYFLRRRLLAMLRLGPARRERPRAPAGSPGSARVSPAVGRQPTIDAHAGEAPALPGEHYTNLSQDWISRPPCDEMEIGCTDNQRVVIMVRWLIARDGHFETGIMPRRSAPAPRATLDSTVKRAPRQDSCSRPSRGNRRAPSPRGILPLMPLMRTRGDRRRGRRRGPVRGGRSRPRGRGAGLCDRPERGRQVHVPLHPRRPPGARRGPDRTPAGAPGLPRSAGASGRSRRVRTRCGPGRVRGRPGGGALGARNGGPTHALKEAGIDADAAFESLSGGYRRRLLIARALVAEARSPPPRRADQPPRRPRHRGAGAAGRGIRRRPRVHDPRSRVPRTARDPDRGDRPGAGHLLAGGLRELPSPQRRALGGRRAGGGAVRPAPRERRVLAAWRAQGAPDPEHGPPPAGSSRCARSAAPGGSARTPPAPGSLSPRANGPEGG